jgi:hypothetical protein
MTGELLFVQGSWLTVILLAVRCNNIYLRKNRFHLTRGPKILLNRTVIYQRVDTHEID